MMRALLLSLMVLILCGTTLSGVRLVGGVNLGVVAVESSTIAAVVTATPIGGTDCVAPCAVHFSALDTTSTVWSREGHTLNFQWMFGDPTSGRWAVSGKPKNEDAGVIAGHLYENPGTYRWHLTVRDRDGDFDTATGTVTVKDPDAEFTSANTWCIRDAADGNFLGCPLDTDDDGTCDGADADHCITQSEWETAITSNTDTSGCNVDAVAGRCLFRRGDSFTQTSIPSTLSSSDGSPVLVGSFGDLSLPRPVVTTTDPDVDFLSISNYTTVFGIEFVGADITPTGHGCPSACNGSHFIVAGSNKTNLTAYDMKATGIGRGCWSNSGQSAAGPDGNDLVAAVEVDCTLGGTHVGPGQTVGWTPGYGERALLLGFNLDQNFAGEFAFRGAIPHGVWAHSRVQRMEPGRNPVQLRNGKLSIEEWQLFHDNHMSANAPNSSAFFRMCFDGSCSATDKALYWPRAVPDMQHVIVENNFFQTEAGFASGLASLHQVQVGDVTIRGNHYDLTGVTGWGSLYVKTANYTATECGGSCPTTNDNFHVYNETIYWPDTESTFGAGITSEEAQEGDASAGYGSGHQVSNILFYAPNFTGSSGLAEERHGWSTSASDTINTQCASGCDSTAGTLPFVGSLPMASGAAALSDFALTGYIAAYSDQGLDPEAIAGTSSVALTMDAWGNYVGRDGGDGGTVAAYDIGATEEASYTSTPSVPFDEFCIAVIGDTQRLTGIGINRTSDEFGEIIDYIAANRSSYNGGVGIQAVLHLGDFTDETGITGGGDECTDYVPGDPDPCGGDAGGLEAEAEMAYGASRINRLDDVMPYFITASSNHDCDEYLSDVAGYDYLTGTIDASWVVPGSLLDRGLGVCQQDHSWAARIPAGGGHVLVISPEYDLGNSWDASVDSWILAQAAAYPDDPIFLLSHFLSYDGGGDDPLQNNPNLRGIFYGHDGSSKVDTKPLTSPLTGQIIEVNIDVTNAGDSGNCGYNGAGATNVLSTLCIDPATDTYVFDTFTVSDSCTVPAVMDATGTFDLSADGPVTID